MLLGLDRDLSNTRGELVFTDLDEVDDVSSKGFLRFAGTTPGDVPVVKPLGDGRAGVFEMTHNDTTGYITHFLAGANMGHTAALDARGIDFDGIGTLYANKKAGRAIVIDQRATVDQSDAYGIHATQRSPAAPLVRLEMQADDAADVLQLIAFSNPGASQKLLYISDPAGEAWNVAAATGIMRGQRTLRVQDNANGTTSYVELSTSGAVDAANSKKTYHTSDADFYFGNAGVATGTYYPGKFAHSASSFAFQTAPNITNKGTNPQPSDVSVWTTQLSFSHSAGVSLAAGMLRANTNVLGFFGATASAKPTITGSRGGNAALADLLTKLATLGLITDGTSA